MLNTQIIRFDASDLTYEFDSHELQKGLDYQRNGKVTHLNILNDGYQITAKVTGKYQPYYELVIDLIDEDDMISIDGTCSCPVEYNCKHVVAALYQALSDSPKQLTVVSKKNTPSPWDQYLHSLEMLSQRKQISPKDPTQKLIYILNIENTRFNQKTLVVTLSMVLPLKKGGWSSPKAFSATAPSHQAAKTPEDELIYHHLEVLQRTANTYGYFYRSKGTYDLSGDHSESILALILKTQRCYWGSKDGAVLSLGEPLQGSFIWELNDSGVQQLKCSLPVEAIEQISTIPPWYLSNQRSVIGRILTNVADDLAEKLMNSPPLLPSQSAQVHQVFQTKFKDLTVIPKPKIFKPTPVQQREIVPCLSLHRGTPLLNDKSLHLAELPFAKVEFEYGKKRILADDPGEQVEYLEKDNIIAIKRDFEKERQFIQQLLEMGLGHLSTQFHFQNALGIRSTFHVGDMHDRNSQFAFMSEQLPILQAQHWKIHIAEDFPLQCVKEDAWYTDIEENSHYNWFGFEMGIIVNDEKINIMPLLVDFIRFQPQNLDPATLNALPDDHYFYLPLGSHRHIAIPAKRIKEILFVLVELYDIQGLCNDKL